MKSKHIFFEAVFRRVVFRGVILGFLTFSSIAHAKLFSFDLEPLIGYERIEKVYPTKHYTNRLYYGARLTLGVPLIALELFGATSESEQNAQERIYKDITYKARAGLVSGFNLGSVVRLQIRGGAQARRSKYDTTYSSVTTTEWTEIKATPYGGAGFRFALSPKLYFTAGATAIFNDLQNLKTTEYETNAGFVIKLP